MSANAPSTELSGARSEAARSGEPAREGGLDAAIASRRVDWVDCAKGITIVLVVYNHVCAGLWTADLPFWPPPYSELATTLNHVRAPLFFFLSGLFVERSAQKRAVAFVIRKLKTLIYPYVIWYLIQSALLIAFSPLTNARPSAAQLLTEMLFSPRGQFWFLLVLFGGDMIYLALNRLGAGRMGVLAIGVVLCASTMAIDIHTLPITIRPFRAFIYLAVGVIAAPSLFRWSGSLPLRVWFAGLGLAIVAMILVAMLFPRRGWAEVPWDKAPWAYPVLASPCGMVFVVALSVLLTRLRLAWPLVFVGSMSLEVLVAHIIGTGGARILLLRFFGVRAMTLHLLAGTAAGLAVPLLLGWWARRFRFSFLFRLG